MQYSNFKKATSRNYKKIIVNNDKNNPLCKNRAVLEVVRLYVQSKNPANFSAVKKTFDDKLQGSLGVVRLVNQIPENFYGRYFMKKNELITLDSGAVFAVCNQWGAGVNGKQGNIERFFDYAKDTLKIPMEWDA